VPVEKDALSTVEPGNAIGGAEPDESLGSNGKGINVIVETLFFFPGFDGIIAGGEPFNGVLGEPGCYKKREKKENCPENNTIHKYGLKSYQK